MGTSVSPWHEVVMWYMSGGEAPTWEWTAYFTLQAPLVVFERWAGPRSRPLFTARLHYTYRRPLSLKALTRQARNEPHPP